MLKRVVKMPFDFGDAMRTRGGESRPASHHYVLILLIVLIAAVVLSILYVSVMNGTNTPGPTGNTDNTGPPGLPGEPGSPFDSATNSNLQDWQTKFP